MKILLDKEFKQIKETIEMYKDNYNKALEDYYKLYKQFKNLHELLIKFQSKNQKLRNKLEEKDKILNKAIEYIEEHSLNFNGECEIDLEVEECKDLVKILKGEE